jgi:hypothetical protein
VDNAIVTTEAEITKKVVIDGSRLEITTSSNAGKLYGDVRLYFYYDDKEITRETISIPSEFIPHLIKALEYIV